MPFAADNVADMEILDVVSHINDAPDEFMAYHHGNGNRFLRPGVPVVDVDVGAADTGAEDLDQDVVDAKIGDRDFIEPQALLAMFLHERFHGSHGPILDPPFFDNQNSIRASP